MVAKRKTRKGFTRSQKEWEETIAGHLGKFIDKLTPHDLIDMAIYGGLAYVSYNTFKTLEGTLFGPISLKLATSGGGMPPVVKIAGMTGLAMLGVLQIPADWETQRYASGAGVPPPDLSPKPIDPETGECPPNHTRIWSERIGQCICIHDNLVTPFQERC